jgi:hypothetical protein
VNAKNIAASVRARLANHAKQINRPHQEVLQYYAMERLLYRVSKSPHGSSFVLKGALMLRVWGAAASRPTKDVDLLGQMSNSLEHIAQVFRDVCTVDVEPDGMVFDAGSIAVALIKEDAVYHGVRVKLLGTLERARASMQVDIGFGDRLVPAPDTIAFPTILDFPAPRLRGYRRETVIAEKLHAMVFLGALNSRMKDFYDVWLLATTFEFDGATLADAIKATFATRTTDIDVAPLALSDEFLDAANTRANWAAFARRLQLAAPASDMRELLKILRVFLGPVVRACVASSDFAQTWHPPGPWT